MPREKIIHEIREIESQNWMSTAMIIGDKKKKDNVTFGKAPQVAPALIGPPFKFIFNLPTFAGGKRHKKDPKP
jgi:hypothetical protein